jgi:hypothetical protein
MKNIPIKAAWVSLVASSIVAILLSFALDRGNAAESDSEQEFETPPVESNQKPSVEDLVKLKQNPVSGLRQVVLQAVVSPNVPESGKTEGTYSIQPVWPFSLSKDLKLITYTILPVVQLPGAPGQDSVVGLGDTLVNLFVSPKKPGAIISGAGPAISLPTRTNPALGTNRPGLGPALVLFYPKNAWSAGVVLQNVWSLGGSGINDVNEFGAQYFVNYNLPHGWYLESNATITADWTAASGNRWTVPVGGGFGNVFNIGSQSVSTSLQAFANVVTPRHAPTWSVIFQFSFLFP